MFKKFLKKLMGKKLIQKPRCNGRPMAVRNPTPHTMAVRNTPSLPSVASIANARPRPVPAVPYTAPTVHHHDYVAPAVVAMALMDDKPVRSASVCEPSYSSYSSSDSYSSSSSYDSGSYDSGSSSCDSFCY